MAPSRWCLQEEGDKVNLLLPSPHQQPGAMLGSQLAFTPHIHLPRWVRLQPSFPDDTPKSESKRQGRDQSPGRLAPASAPGALAEDARVPLSLPSLALAPPGWPSLISASLPALLPPAVIFLWAKRLA